MVMLIRRSRNSQARSPRSVTFTPMALPSRSLNPAIDFLARVTTGFWPEITSRSRWAPSMSEACWVALPTPMLRTIFSSRGTCMTLSRPSWSLSAARNSAR